MKTMLLTCALALALNPLSYLNTRFATLAPQTQSQSLKADEIPTVSYCEMVRRPQLFFGKSVRLRAVWERAAEGIYLRDPACQEQVAVGFHQAKREQWCEREGQNFKTIYDEKFAGRAEIVVVGKLENRSRKGSFFNYDYLFVANCIEKVMTAAESYQGTLEEGHTYRARVKCSDEEHEPSLLIRVSIPFHHAVSVEWDNLEEYPQLKAGAGADCEREIVFQVLSRQIVQVYGQRRWNTTYNCKIIEVE